MGKSFEQHMKEFAAGGGQRGQLGVTVVTNQDNGIASYATGVLLYHPTEIVGWVSRPARLSTTGAGPLKHYFSDRPYVITQPASITQPFSAKDTDQLGMSIASPYLGIGGVVAKFTLHSWGNSTFSVALEPRGNLLVGVGGPIGNRSDHAVYVVSFHEAASRER